jgi:hypothetical protein
MGKLRVIWKVTKILFFNERLNVIKSLVQEAEGFGVPGNRKQPWVVNNAVTALPGSSRKDIATMIELVLQEENK